MSTQNSEEFIQDVRRAVELGGQAFKTRMREALASFDVAEVWDAVLAHIRLEMQEEHSAGPIQDLRHHAEFIGRAFVNLLDRGVIKPIAPLTELGEKAIQNLRRTTGIYLDDQSPAPEARPLSAQERLAEEVKADWKKLNSDQFRKKMNSNTAYRRMYEELANSDQLESSVTTSYQIAEDHSISSRS